MTSAQFQSKPSYIDKIDTRLFMLMFALSYLPEESGMDEGGSLAMLPELYEKYEEEGCPEEGIAAGTKWEDVPDDWVCPDCGAAKSDFEMCQF